MPCTSPLDAWPAAPGAPNRRPVFSAFRSFQGAKPFSLPCGQCMGCRLDRAQDLSTRAVHEAQMCAAEGLGSSFVTLTFDDEHLPADLSLDVQFVQAFHKRLRHLIGRFRFLIAGEYGDVRLRPHYHALYFGKDFRADRYLWKRTNGGLLYRSPTLEKAWPYGHALIADFTREAAGYTARYVTKKVGGDRSDLAYRRCELDAATGELREWQVLPEFMLSSRMPGLGASWFERYHRDVFPSDFLVIDGRKVPVPRFYLMRLAAMERLKLQAQRKVAARRFADNNTDRRLMTRHESQRLRAKLLRRGLDAEE